MRLSRLVTTQSFAQSILSVRSYDTVVRPPVYSLPLSVVCGNMLNLPILITTAAQPWGLNLGASTLLLTAHVLKTLTLAHTIVDDTREPNHLRKLPQQRTVTRPTRCRTLYTIHFRNYPRSPVPYLPARPAIKDLLPPSPSNNNSQTVSPTIQLLLALPLYHLSLRRSTNPPLLPLFSLLSTTMNPSTNAKRSR